MLLPVRLNEQTGFPEPRKLACRRTQSPDKADVFMMVTGAPRQVSHIFVFVLHL